MQYLKSHLFCNKGSHNTLLDFFVLTFLRYDLFVSSFERRQHVWSKIYGNILCEISSSTLLSPMLHFFSALKTSENVWFSDVLRGYGN